MSDQYLLNTIFDMQDGRSIEVRIGETAEAPLHFQFGNMVWLAGDREAQRFKRGLDLVAAQIDTAVRKQVEIPKPGKRTFDLFEVGLDADATWFIHPVGGRFFYLNTDALAWMIFALRQTLSRRGPPRQFNQNSGSAEFLPAWARD